MRRYTSLQHKELSESRIQRDNADQDLLMNFFEYRNPFRVGIDKGVFSIYTGIIGGSDINCYNAECHGKSIMSKLVGQNFEEIKLKRNDKVRTLNPHTVKIRNEIVTIDPRQLFNRIVCSCTSPQQLEECFNFELSTESTSLFENFMMRKTQKSSLFQIFEKHLVKFLNDNENIALQGRLFYFIDGGFLLHKVVWQPNSTYEQIYDQYAKYISAHYGRACHIIFDGYSDQLSTKIQEQTRRAGSAPCPEIIFEDSMVTNVSQSKFLTNSKNKSRLISRLSRVLLERGHSVTQCKGDADTSIVNTALPFFGDSDSSHIVVSEDIDILTLLIHHCEYQNVFMLRSFGTHKIINIATLRKALGDVITRSVLFIHAVTGGDKTSALYKKGKSSAISILPKNQHLSEEIGVFYKNNANIAELCRVGELFLLKLYNAPKDVLCINKFRFIKFNQMTARNNLSKEVDLACLPPTKNALNEHIFRVYHQIQEWCGNVLDPLEWGWTIKGNNITPSQGITDVAPKFIMELIFCNCKKSNCQNLCSCRKFGLRCSAQCGNWKFL